MSGVGILLSVFLLAITLIDHRVSSRTYSGLTHDNVELSAKNRFIKEQMIPGKYYYHTGSVELPSKSCCLVFKQSNTQCDDSVPTFPSGCGCNVVYQALECTNRNHMRLYAEAVQRANGSAVIFTTEDAEKDAFIVYDRNSLLRIPVMFVMKENSETFYGTLKDEFNLTVKIEFLNDPDDERNGFNNGRSATTFYFVVFAFTILLLLSLTWFVFNYLRRCHHMYTVKRQRAEMLSKTRRAIEKCPTKTYKKIKKAAQKTAVKDEVDSVVSEEEERCPICLETFKMKDVVRVLPCHHEFHKSCIDPWLYEKGTCPMCKLNIVGNEDECNSEQVSRDLRILSMEEGLPTASDHSTQRQDNADETLQVESIE